MDFSTLNQKQTKSSHKSDKILLFVLCDYGANPAIKLIPVTNLKWQYVITITKTIHLGKLRCKTWRWKPIKRGYNSAEQIRPQSLKEKNDLSYKIIFIIGYLTLLWCYSKVTLCRERLKLQLRTKAVKEEVILTTLCPDSWQLIHNNTSAGISR